MSKLTDDFHAFVHKLTTEGHHLADEGRDLLARLCNSEHAIAADAAADASQVTADAETAAAPVIAEVEHDAKTLTTEAETAAAAAATSPAPAEPPAPSAS